MDHWLSATIDPEYRVRDADFSAATLS